MTLEKPDLLSSKPNAADSRALLVLEKQSDQNSRLRRASHPHHPGEELIEKDPAVPVVEELKEPRHLVHLQTEDREPMRDAMVNGPRVELLEAQ